MAKFKTIPSMGTRKIIMPVIGEVSFENGTLEMTQEQYSELIKLDFGFKVLPFDHVPDSQSNVDPSQEGNSVSLDSLLSLRVKDLDEIASSLLSSAVITEEEHKDYLNMKKAERAEFISQASNR